MNDKKKTKVPATAETKPAGVATIEDTAKQEEVASEAPATALKTEKKVKEEKKKKKGKDKAKKDKKDKKDKKK